MSGLRWDPQTTSFGVDKAIALVDGPFLHADFQGIFSVILRCSNVECGQCVAVLGDYRDDPTADLKSYQPRKYIVRDVYPAIPLIDIPTSSTTAIVEALQRSFGLS
jgi:hypothetical protein